MFKTINEVQRAMENARYICDRALATSVYLSHVMGKPLLIEGEAGVGKTELAKVVAEVLQAQLIRLQCYEGLDVEHALYEWNYPKQILHIQLAQTKKEREGEIDVEQTIFSEKFLLKRPLLEAIQSSLNVPVVLLIDEIDRADEGFEAFLLEVFSDFQITIPEIGTIKATRRPYVIIDLRQSRRFENVNRSKRLTH